MGNPIGPPTYTYDQLLADRAEKLTSLGPDCCFQWLVGSSKPDTRVGILVWHRAQDGRPCGGYVNFDPSRKDGPTWTVESEDPLTISPSVLCKGTHGCGGSHGYIRCGRWEEC